MALPHCSRLFGEAVITTDEPTVRLYDECVFRPMSKTVFLDRDNSWGLYTPGGSIIDEAAYRRGEKNTLVGQSEFCFNNDIAEESEEDCVYFGPIIPHYGHFIITSLSRLWFVVGQLKNGRKLLAHSDHGPESYFENPYMGPLLRAAGLSLSDFVSPTVVTRFRNVLVPSPAFVEQNHASLSYIPELHAIGRKLLKGATPERGARCAYLSKSQMPAGSVSWISNEYELENLLRSAGFDIIYPEKLSIPEQVEIFYKYRSIVGFVGSAFHSNVFCDDPPLIFGLSLEKFVNSNLVILDKLNNVGGGYFDATQHLMDSQRDGYLVSKQIKNPAILAKEIVSTVGIASGDAPLPASSSLGIYDRSSSMSLFSYFLDNKGRPIHKSGHYFFAYERHFSKYRNQPCTFLEIGAGNGGSSQMWKRWFGPHARIVTIDINPVCLQYGDEQVEVRIGDQSDPVFLQSLMDEFGVFDAVLDDGSHHMDHVPKTFEFLYPRIASNGVYMIEDMHTAYWENYGGGIGAKTSMVEKFKSLIDNLNASHIHDGSILADDFTNKTIAMTAYDSILVFEKTPFANKIMRIVGDDNLRVNY